MDGLTLHPMKEIKIIIEGEHLHFVTDVLDQIKASGYTIFNNISGKGHGGFHEGHMMFNDTSSLQMILTIVPEEKVEPILSGIKPFWNVTLAASLCWMQAYCALIILIPRV